MTIVAEESFVAEKTFTLRSGSGAGSVGSGVRGRERGRSGVGVGSEWGLA
jgi:hypothetical protein